MELTKMIGALMDHCNGAHRLLLMKKTIFNLPNCICYYISTLTNSKTQNFLYF